MPVIVIAPVFETVSTTYKRLRPAEGHCGDRRKSGSEEGVNGAFSCEARNAMSPRSPTPPVQILAYQAAVVKVADQQMEQVIRRRWSKLSC
jgi:hypothetical protein